MPLIITTKKITASCQFTQQSKVDYDTHPDYWDAFGTSVSMSGDGNTAIIGAPYGYTYNQDPDGIDTGSAYIFIKSGNNWLLQQELIPSDGDYSDYFGGSVSISDDGNTVIVGAFSNDPDNVNNAGSSYIFTRSGSTWSQQAKIIASDAQANDEFGWSVSISGDGNTAIVGAYLEDPDEVWNAGSSYIFTRSGSAWSQQAKITASDKKSSERFGYSVSISSDSNTILVGAPYRSPGLNIAGSVYVFTKNENIWTEKEILEPNDPLAFTQFGVSVSLSNNGNTSIVGKVGDTDTDDAAYIFACL